MAQLIQNKKRAETVPPPKAVNSKSMRSNSMRPNSSNLQPTFSLKNNKVCDSYHLFYFLRIQKKNRNFHQKKKQKKSHEEISKMVQMKSRKILKWKKETMNNQQMQ